MATTKVTFTLDAETIARLQRTAERLARSKSAVLREAIRDYSERTGRLGEAERRRLLETFDRLVPGLPPRRPRDVAKELAELKRSRRAAARRGSPVAR